MIRKFFASLLIIIFIPIFVAALFLHGVYSSLTSAEFFKSALSKTGAYDTIFSQSIPELIEGFPDEGESLLAIINKKEAQTLLSETISTQELQGLVEKTINGVTAYINFETEEVSLTYNFKKYKTNLRNSYKKLIINKLNSLPVCTNAQLQNQLESEGFPMCKPPGESGSGLYGQLQIEQEITKGLGSLPNELTITTESISAKPKNTIKSDAESPLENLPQIRENLHNLSIVRLFGFVISVVILGLVVLLRLFSWRSISTWLGWSVAIGSGLATAIALALRFAPFFTARIADILGAPASLSNLASEISKELVSGLTYEIFLISIPAFVLGVVLILTSAFIRKKEAKTTTNNNS